MFRSSRSKKLLFIISLLVCLCLALYVYFSNNTEMQMGAGGDKLVVTVIDVGQGDSVLITLEDNTMLIDAAQNPAPVLEELREQNIDDIDVLIATHPHDDHIGGMKDIIENYDIGAVYMADTESDAKVYMQLIEAIDEHRIPLKEAYAGIEFSFGDALCTFVSPGRYADDDANNESAALFLDYYDSEFLFTGDMEKKAEKSLLSGGYYIDADVLKTAHHGSSTGTTKEFLDAVTPEYAAISCGEGNAYGHPHDETLRLLEACGASIIRTENSGDITFITDGNTIEVSVERPRS